MLLVLAAAALAQPDTPWTFGALGHACPGQDLARRHAAGALAHLLRAGADAPALAARHRYRPLPNARLPCLTAPGRTPMIAVIFEVEPAQGDPKPYLDIAATLIDELKAIDGFISVERFQSPEHAGQAAVAVVLAR